MIADTSEDTTTSKAKSEQIYVATETLDLSLGYDAKKS